MATTVEISLLIPEAEFLAWSRIAERHRSDLPAWIRTVVNHHIETPVARPTSTTRAPSALGAPTLYRLDQATQPSACEYCGLQLPFDATRRRRYCSDECRVRAWRYRTRTRRKTINRENCPYR
jgi:hypothetical protein